MPFSLSLYRCIALSLFLSATHSRRYFFLFFRKIICCAFKQSLDMKYRFYNIFMAQKFIENNNCYEWRTKWNTKILFANWATDYRNPLYIFGNNVCTPNSPDFKMPNYLNMSQERPNREERKSQRVQLHGKLCRIYAFTPVFDKAAYGNEHCWIVRT